MQELQTQPQPKQRGQALVEYALILVLVAIGFGVALAATGPAIGNVFNNVLYNVIGADPNAAVTPVRQIGGAPDSFWATVTWVAANPQRETPFPTPANRPTEEVGPGFIGSWTPSATFTSSPTPTNTSSPTFTSTLTPTLTNTFGPSATPTDIVFSMPHVDQMGNAEWWRLSSNFSLGEGGWSVTWWNTSTIGTGTSLTQQVDTIGYDWGGGDGSPFPTPSAQFSGRFTRTVNITTPTQVTFFLSSDDNSTLFVNNAPVVSSSFNNPQTVTTTLNPGTVNLRIDYQETGGGAYLYFNAGGRMNPDDSTAGCTWQPYTEGSRTKDMNSSPWMFGHSPLTTNIRYNAGQQCVLELRGYVDISSNTQNPVLSFWDFWDLPAGMQARVEVADYVEQMPSPPTLNRAAVSWRPVQIRNGGTSNYQWTRNEIDLSQLSPSPSSTKITFRFVLVNTGAQTPSGVPVRWYIDDVQLLNDTRALNGTVTVGDSWNLDTAAQQDDFIFHTDSNRTLEITGGIPVQRPQASNEWRWRLTSNRARSGMAWDDSPGVNHAERLTDTNTPRRIYLEFREWFDLRGTLPPDPNGFDGNPLLTFWTSYEVGDNVSLEVQYTTVSRHRSGVPSDPANPDGWTTFTDGVLRRAGGCGGGTPCGRNERTDTNGNAVLNWREVIVPLSSFSGWNSQPFRVRFVMTIPGTSTRQGWYIDDIAILRDNSSVYQPYPFFDGAENQTATRSNWNLGNGSWGISSERGGASDTGIAYADSPSANYAGGTNTWMEMRRTLDLNFDTPANINNIAGSGEPATRPPASRPILSFWHQRRLANGDVLAVDMWVVSRGTWTPVWTLTANNQDVNTHAHNATQDTWERVEIDLESALLNILSVANWAAVTNTATPTDDDDIRLRIRLQTANGNNAAGVLVDDIRVDNLNEVTHRLWATNATFGNGDGIYIDTIDRATRSLAGGTAWFNTSLETNADWFTRWHRGGGWRATSSNTPTSSDPRSHVWTGPQALYNRPTPPSDYSYLEEYILEMRPVIDLRGTTAADRPVMYFWSRFEIGDGDRIRVQIARENTSDNALPQVHENLARWDPWSPTRSDIFRGNCSSPTIIWQQLPDCSLQQGDPRRYDTWQRYQVNLTPYAGNRIRVRFMLDSDNDQEADSLGDGWFIDDVTFSYGVNRIPVNPAFEDDASTTGNWITEGANQNLRWGLAQDYFRTASTSDEILGDDAWRGHLFDCELLASTVTPAITDCANGSSNRWGSPNSFDRLLRRWTTIPTGTPLGAGIRGAEVSEEVRFNPGTNAPTFNGVALPSADFTQTYAGRWMRNVTLFPGTYTFQLLYNEGVRLRVNDATGINVGGAPLAVTNDPNYGAAGGWLINDWTSRSESGATVRGFISVSVEVTGFTPLNRQLMLEWFEQDGTASVELYITRQSYSFTDSPNIPNASGGFTVVNSAPHGNSSLMLNGVFDFTGAANPRLLYYRLYDLRDDNSLFVEYSTDGGFNWTTITSGDDSFICSDPSCVRMSPSQDWDDISVNLPNAAGNANYMIRFRLDTWTSGGAGTGDGVYIADIRVTPG